MNKFLHVNIVSLPFFLTFIHDVHVSNKLYESFKTMFSVYSMHENFTANQVL